MFNTYRFTRATRAYNRTHVRVGEIFRGESLHRLKMYYVVITHLFHAMSSASCKKTSVCHCSPQTYLGALSTGDGGGFVSMTPWQTRYQNQTGFPVTFRSQDANASKFGPIVREGIQTTEMYPCTPLQPGADPNSRIRRDTYRATVPPLMQDLADANTSVMPGGPPPIQVRDRPAPELGPPGLSPGVEPIAEPTGGYYIF